MNIVVSLLMREQRYNGYAADITRTYSAKENHEFTALVKDMNDAQQALIATMKAGSTLQRISYSNASTYCRIIT